jgi:branched-chain amino acid aminotransferase
VSDALPAFWVNGERQSSSSRHISAGDRGLTLADGVFETMRANGGTVFRLDRHLARLVHGLTTLDIPARPNWANGSAPPCVMATTWPSVSP